MKEYKIRYDPEADAAYVKIKSGTISDTIEVSEDMFLDVDSRKHIIGLEILNFSKKKINLNELIARQFGNLVAVVK